MEIDRVIGKRRSMQSFRQGNHDVRMSDRIRHVVHENLHFGKYDTESSDQESLSRQYGKGESPVKLEGVMVGGKVWEIDCELVLM